MGGKQSKPMTKKPKISRDAIAFWESIQKRASEQINQSSQEVQFPQTIHQNTSNSMTSQQVNNKQEEEEIYYDLIDDNFKQCEQKQTQTGNKQKYLEQEQITVTKQKNTLQFSSYSYGFKISLSQVKIVQDSQGLEQFVEQKQNEQQNKQQSNPISVEKQLDQVLKIQQDIQCEQQQPQVQIIQNNKQQKQKLITQKNDEQTQVIFQNQINSQVVNEQDQTEGQAKVEKLKILPQQQTNLIQQQKYQVFNEEILSKFLQRCFQIELAQGKVGQINYSRIKQVRIITSEFVVKELMYVIISDKKLLLAEKIEFLLKTLNKLGESKKQSDMIEVKEGFIDQKQFDDIVFIVIDNILKAMLNPSKYIDQEDINKLEDKNNFVACQIYESFFCKNPESYFEDPFNNPALDLLLNFVEQNCKQDDALKFMELICKREVRNCSNVNLDDCLNQLKAVQLLVKISHFPKLQDLILENSWAYGKFELFKTGRELQKNSIFGSVMSISTFPRDFPDVIKKFYNRETSLPIQVERYRGPIYSIIHSMVDVFKRILRRGKNSQILLFTFLTKIIEINLNLLKVKQPDQFNKCCYQGMMFNLQQILLELFNPFIQDFETAKKRVEKVNYKLLSSIKHHPLLVKIYGKVEQVSPLKCKFIPLDQEPESDLLTFLYLLIQRINHLQHHMILDYVEAFVLFQYDKKIYGQSSKFARESEAEKAAFDTLLLHPCSVKNTIQFLSFQSLVAMNLLDINYEAKYPFGLLADTFINDMIHYSFIYNCNDVALDYLEEITSICQFTIISLKYEKLIENIHVRVGGIQIFYILNFYIQQTSSTAQKAYRLFSEDKVIKDCLIDGLIKAFIDHDKIKGHELVKSNLFLGSLTSLFAYALITHEKIYAAKLIKYFEKNNETYKKFAFIYIGQCKELFDECLTKMLEVKTKEDQDQSQQQLTAQEKLIQAIEKSILHKELYLNWKIFEESYSNVVLFTKIQPQAFLIEETIQQLAQNLNEIIQELNGPDSNKYQSNFMKNNKITPQKIMTSVIELFINLQKHEVFLEQVVQDERNFKIDDLYKIINKLQAKQIITSNKLQEFNKIIQKLEVLKNENEQIQTIINSNQDFSQRFIDPLTGYIMYDPVQLPNSKIIVDRITIKRLLIKKQEDPFDRSLLNENMLVEQTNLKLEITSFINEKRQQLRIQRQI